MGDGNWSNICAKDGTQASLPNGVIGGIFVTGVAYFKRLCASLFLSANIFFLSSWKLTQSSQAICCSMRQVRLEMDDFIIIFHPSLHHNIHIYTYHHNHHYHHTVLAFANLGCFSKQTPMNWTMFGCWNLLMIRASIKKSISAEIQLWTFPLWQMTTTLVCWQLWQCFNGYGCFSKLERTVVSLYPSAW